jgi:hypothetical protein
VVRPQRKFADMAAELEAVQEDCSVLAQERDALADERAQLMRVCHPGS